MLSSTVVGCVILVYFEVYGMIEPHWKDHRICLLFTHVSREPDFLHVNLRVTTVIEHFEVLFSTE